MGKIILVLGPHGVGKTTLFRYASTRTDCIVCDGYQISSENLNLSETDDFIEYQHKYIESINRDNRKIKESEHNGIVIRSFEESSYYYEIHRKRDIVMKDYYFVFNNKENIKVDKLVYLDASSEELKYRYMNDENRDMQETAEWYDNKYAFYDTYWKRYPGIIVIDTTNKTTEEIYDLIMEI